MRIITDGLPEGVLTADELAEAQRAFDEACALIGPGVDRTELAKHILAAIASGIREREMIIKAALDGLEPKSSS